MVFRILILFCFIFTLQLAKAQNRFRSDSGMVHFVSEAPLELIEAQTTDFKIIVDTVDAAFAATIAVGSFQGFNSPLQQEHFHENYMESETHPKATFVGKILSPFASGTQPFTLQVKGKLKIHGVEQNRIIEVKCRWTENGNLLAEARFIVPLEDHDIEIPRIVYRKIAEEIQVSVSAELSPFD
ncbi:MAG TPA: YceI family protein [Cryomorphaceae bacterium]|nr:YceI family protein [Cryomorphaceae bacterium]